MGLSEIDLRYFAWLGSEGKVDWSRVDSLLDLGEQELDCHGDIEALQDFLYMVDPKAAGADLQQYTGHCLFREPLALTRLRYQCLDVIPNGTCLFHDLNFDSLPANLVESFDLVCNCGTTEHLHNQLNAFSVIHQATRPVGYMYHCLPMAGITNHGLFNYNPKFFGMLSKYNQYYFVDSYLLVDPEPSGLDPDILGLIYQDKPFLARLGKDNSASTANLFQANNTYLVVLLKKTQSGVFRPGLDLLGHDDSVVDLESGRLRTPQSKP